MFFFDARYNVMIGGRRISMESKSKEIKYKYNEHIFVINEVDDGDIISYSLQNGTIDETVCMILHVCRDEHFVYVNNISYQKKYIVEGMPKAKGGTLLLHLMFDFVNQYLKSKYSLKYIQLKDNSFLYCKQTKKNINFDSMYMFIRGMTWYGKYGFVPFDELNKNVNVDGLVDYKVNQKLVNIIPVKCTRIREYIESAVWEIGDKNLIAKFNKKNWISYSKSTIMYLY